MAKMSVKEVLKTQVWKILREKNLIYSTMIEMLIKCSTPAQLRITIKKMEDWE